MLQQKQQEQLKQMIRVLEDGEEKSLILALNQSSRQGAAGEEHTQRGDEDDAMQVTRQSMEDETINNGAQGEDARDADS
ncbi:hypothetical protein GOP47_0026776 [Adiantum capillus-veneris]|nr:hypothetical protein GOP47_0026776 [Adiantum capillus-veneris]